MQTKSSNTKMKKHSEKSSSPGFLSSLWTTRFFLGSTIGRKIYIALVGLFLVGFIIVHLLGNFLLYVGPEAFNAYAYNLERNRTLLYIMEIILAGGFLKHIGMSIYISLKNKAARPVGYVKRRTLGMSNIFSRNMFYSGSIIFIFLVIHIRSFRVIEGPLIYSETYGVEIRNLYAHVMSYFDIPLYSAFYIFAMIFVGGHVSHGLQSAFRSLGLGNKRIYPALKKFSIAMGIFFGVGFASIPFYFGFIV